jgi:hypothetical protein
VRSEVQANKEDIPERRRRAVAREALDNCIAPRSLHALEELHRSIGDDHELARLRGL